MTTAGILYALVISAAPPTPPDYETQAKTALALALAAPTTAKAEDVPVKIVATLPRPKAHLSYADAVTAGEKSGRPIVVMLGSDSCPPCRKLKPELLAADLDAEVCYLDGDANPVMLDHWKVTVYPTVYVGSAKAGSVGKILTGGEATLDAIRSEVAKR